MYIFFLIFKSLHENEKKVYKQLDNLHDIEPISKEKKRLSKKSSDLPILLDNNTKDKLMESVEFNIFLSIVFLTITIIVIIIICICKRRGRGCKCCNSNSHASNQDICIVQKNIITYQPSDKNSSSSLEVLKYKQQSDVNATTLSKSENPPKKCDVSPTLDPIEQKKEQAQYQKNSYISPYQSVSQDHIYSTPINTLFEPINPSQENSSDFQDNIYPI